MKKEEEANACKNRLLRGKTSHHEIGLLLKADSEKT